MQSINGKRLSPEKLKALHDDIRVRVGIQRDMAPHTQGVIEAELGVSVKTVQRIEQNRHASENPYRIRPALVNEIARRRQIYCLAKERLDSDYSVEALSKRHQLAGSTIERHIRIVKDQMIQESMQRQAA